jgi:UDP-N-acetylmuramate--alanine ligase
MDADHLDIYGTHKAMKEAFRQFASRIKPGGILLIKYGLSLPVSKWVRVFTYSLDNIGADFYASDIRINNDSYVFSLNAPLAAFSDIRLGVPGLVNVENAVAAAAAFLAIKGIPHRFTAAMASFEGIQRRFDVRLRTGETVYIDDYAHHPEELRFMIQSVRELYPGKQITGVFQPHLYSRTRDFADEFAQSLSLLDSLILLDIYPAREEPIESVTSKIIFDKVTIADKCLCGKEEVINILKNRKPDVLLTLGAGDIDTLVEPIEKMLKNKFS